MSHERYPDRETPKYWNSQENRTPMSKTLSGKRVISEASPFDQWWEIQFIGSVAPAAVVVGLDPVEYDLPGGTTGQT